MNLANASMISRLLAPRFTTMAAILLALLSTPAPARAERAFDACLGPLRAEALARGIAAETFDRHTRGLVPDRSVLEALDFQPEFKTPIWDYLAALVDEERIADGRAMLERWRGELAEVERRYGVDPFTVVAVWGVESDFGRAFGHRPLVTSLATLSCFGRRQPYFRGEFISALRILQDGHIAPEQLVGSWAGAFGHTQFMPSTFLATAVDFDGDGRRDLVGSVPDALASTANFLKRAGWRRAEPWGFEVRLPAGFDASVAGRRNRRPLSDWIARGVRPVAPAQGEKLRAARQTGFVPSPERPQDRSAPSPPPVAVEEAWGGPPLPPDTRAAVLLPAGRDGPSFLVFRNFDAIYGYNAAESYALAIAHLADRLRGGGPFAAAWPTDDPGLSRAERRELQTLLIARGHDIGEVDGRIGERSRVAIKAEERRLGRVESGRAGLALLRALRSGGG
jgi:lytic murein transglycosylase